MSKRASVVACLVMTVSVGVIATQREEPYAWPAPPDAPTLARAKATPSASGLVVIDREARITIRSLGAEPYGVVREEFVRLVVTSDAGVRRASLELNDDADARVTRVEGRTVAPDGTVTALDSERDVRRVELRGARRKRAFTVLATVSFPAPALGALLDLHYVTESDDLVLAYAQPMVYSGIPALETAFKLTLKSDIVGAGWSVVTLGQGRGSVGRAAEAHTLVARLGYYAPPKVEPLGLPVYHEQMTVLAFLDLTSARGLDRKPGGSFHAALDIDGFGCISGSVFDSPSSAEYWQAVLKEIDRTDSKAIAHAGRADRIEVERRAPATMPSAARLEALYDITQQQIEYNPDAENVVTVGDMLRKGMSDGDQGTLLFATLLRRAGIPFHIAEVADRYRLRFSPVVNNEFLFGFAKAVVVELPGEPPRFFMPGELTLPCGTLPDNYQRSVALLLDDGGAVRTLVTPFDPAALDAVTWHHDLTLDADGGVKGRVSLTERGAPAWTFARWNMGRKFRLANPRKADKTSGEKFAKDWQEALDASLEDELSLPGQRLFLEGGALTREPSRTEKELVLGATAQGRGFAQVAGDKWLVSAHPTLAGFENPFTDQQRRTPIWYPTSGHTVLEGDLRLPPRTTVVELPSAWQFDGPLGAVSRGAVEAREENGVTVLHSRVEYDLPPIVPLEAYVQWRAYVENLARVGQERVIVTLPAAKELE